MNDEDQDPVVDTDETQELDATPDVGDTDVQDDAPISAEVDDDSSPADDAETDDSSRAAVDDEAPAAPSQELVDMAKGLGLDHEGMDADSLQYDIAVAMRVLAKSGELPADDEQDAPETPAPKEEPPANVDDTPAPVADDVFTLSDDEVDILRDRLDDDGFAVIKKLTDRLSQTEAALNAIRQDTGGVKEHIEAQRAAQAEAQANEVVRRFHGLVDELELDDLFGKTDKLTGDSEQAKNRQKLWDFASNLERAAQAQGKQLGDDKTLLKLAAQAAFTSAAQRLQARDLKKKARSGSPRGRSASKAPSKASADPYDRILARAEEGLGESLRDAPDFS